MNGKDLSVLRVNEKNISIISLTYFSLICKPANADLVDAAFLKDFFNDER